MTPTDVVSVLDTLYVSRKRIALIPTRSSGLLMVSDSLAVLLSRRSFSERLFRRSVNVVVLGTLNTELVDLLVSVRGIAGIYVTERVPWGLADRLKGARVPLHRLVWSPGSLLR
jgi:hypothetical protein